ncbi:GroES-like protein [Rhizodiscina lignyota]|uniref:GroES-like protein n=1 Tax=Rhizodiscina lignyota TaxID=1504668 RepID=A0A9P4M2N8_9PEZI|nr:GroES-like protein [Rhizodiscina lignyota]
MPHVAVWIDEESNLAPQTVEEGSYHPGESEILVKVIYSSINPADLKHAVFSKGSRNTICGYEFSGIVEETGAGSKFKVGDKVFGTTPVDYTGKGRKPEWGGYQSRLVCPDVLAAHVPDSLPLSHAAGISLIARTMGDAMFNLFKFPFPPEDRPHAIGTPFLIWGGSSALGHMTIWVAKLLGLHPILTTASPHNAGRLKGAGATEVFDYHSDTVTADIRAYMDQYFDGRPIMQAFDAVSIPKPRHTVELVEDCCAPDAIILSAGRHPRHDGPFGEREYDWPILLPDGTLQVVRHKSDEGAAMQRRVVDWAAANYGWLWKLPPLKIVKGAQAGIEESKRVAFRGAGFEKVVVEHENAMKSLKANGW